MDRGPYRGQEAVDETEGGREDRGPYRGQDVEEIEGGREDRGP